jgi:hypothetical protein
MTTSKPQITEHFCTLFDSNFLPLGMTLHSSLIAYAQPFHLWILCMDELVEQQLQQLNLSYVTLIPLREVESQHPELLNVKPGRSHGEYCWTLTPFTPQAVFNRDASVNQVTYLDADLFFFDDPRLLLEELQQNHKDVLITEHAYAPEYEYRVALNGRFCVQFLTFKNTEKAFKVMHWWQDKCLEWCFSRIEDGKFGDQKYLDLWPELFGAQVHVVEQTDKTLAPWNVNYFDHKLSGKIKPVFYHFHGLRIISPSKARLFLEYQIKTQGKILYCLYEQGLQEAIDQLKQNDIPVPYISTKNDRWDRLRGIKRLITGRVRYQTIN